jgi:hypothetical protein
MPKQTKTTSKKKIVTSKGSRRISTPVGVFFALGIGLLLAVAGTYGYTKYKERDLQAKAAKWKSVTPYSVQRNGGDGVKFVACREYLDIGPDTQQSKRVKVHVLASKPKTLKGVPKDQYGAYMGIQVYKSNTGQWFGTSTTGLKDRTIWNAPVGHKINNVWWNNELSYGTTDSNQDVRVGDKIAPYVSSEKSLQSWPYETRAEAFKDFPNANQAYINSPSPFASASSTKGKDLKTYNKEVKDWANKSISVAQLPNCN